jgi:CheY-like chemotaxis protein/HPt (histidine-containing phosphotransfer) domain-containing protein
LLETPPTEALHAATTTAQDTKGALTGRRVLIVDDGETNRRLLNVFLKQTGAVVEMAENGRIAVDLAMTRDFDAILMDMQMPVLDGYSATRELRSRGLTVPIIALTAHAMAGEEQKCRDAGCDGYLSKPVSRELLIKLLTELTKDRAFAPLPTQTDFAIRSELLETAEPEIQAIVADFVDQLPNRLALLQGTLERKDWSSLEAAAHALKGTAGMTGFPSLATEAGLLEAAATSQDLALSESIVLKIADLVSSMQTTGTVRMISLEAAS